MLINQCSLNVYWHPVFRLSCIHLARKQKLWFYFPGFSFNSLGLAIIGRHITFIIVTESSISESSVVAFPVIINLILFVLLITNYDAVPLLYTTYPPIGCTFSLVLFLRKNFRLENKYKTLAEKKNALQTELVAKSQEVETLRREVSEVDAKKCEARKHAASMEALVSKYEQRNFELEESEMETKCKLQILENAWPAIVLWNIWRMVCKHYRKSKATRSTAVEYPQKRPAAEVDADYLEKLRIMTGERIEMEKRIRDLEFKENVYQQTLQQADNILANVEEGYKQKIEELNAELAEKRRQLTDRETRMRLSADSRHREPELLDRIHGLETELRDLAHKLNAKDVEKQSWARRETQLRSDIEQFVNEVCQIKAENSTLRNQLDCERMKFKDLRKDLDFKQSVCAELEEKSNVEVNARIRVDTFFSKIRENS